MAPSTREILENLVACLCRREYVGRVTLVDGLGGGRVTIAFPVARRSHRLHCREASVRPEHDPLEKGLELDARELAALQTVQ